MRIKNFEIKKLFGTFDYLFGIDPDDKFLILTGLNGYGKTTILNIINALSTSDLFFFYRLPFDELRILFEEGFVIVIETIMLSNKGLLQTEGFEKPDVPVVGGKEVVFRWIGKNGEESQLSIDERAIRKSVRRIGYYRGHFEDSEIDSKEFYQFVKETPKVIETIAAEQNGSAFLLQLKSLNTVFVEAQRLFLPKGDDSDIHRLGFRANEHIASYTIDAVTAKIAKRLEEARYKFLRFSQEKDNHFIDKLLNQSFQSFGKSDYGTLKEEVLSKILDLKDLGLVDDIKVHDYDGEHAEVLSAYLTDLREKIAVLDDVYKKAKLYLELIEEKDFTNKDVALSITEGLKIKTKDGVFLNPTDLSSGEQNAIIMLYYLIFEFDDDSLLLIDEPEISLHIAWQYQFVNDLEKILATKGGTAIIATHSPQIIAERWDKCYDLSEAGHE